MHEVLHTVQTETLIIHLNTKGIGKNKESRYFYRVVHLNAIIPRNLFQPILKKVDLECV